MSNPTATACCLPGLLDVAGVNQTRGSPLLEEWAYARAYRSETERAAAYPVWLHTYNHHRGHTALDGKSPADVVTNLRGQNS